MPSILYSTTCVIRNDLFRLRIYVDELNSTDERLSSPFSPVDIPLNLIQPSLTRIDFQWVDEKKTKNNNNIPPSITLHHLLNVQQTVSPLSKSKNKADRSSLEASSRSITAPATPTIEQSQDIAQISVTPSGTQVLLKRRPFSFGRFFSIQPKSSSETTLLSKTSIQIDFIDVSDSIRWNVKTLELEMDTEEVASELYANLNLCLSTLKQRPRRLLAFVNPLSGKARARLVYEKKVVPIFNQANVSVDTIYTERAGHAEQYILNEPLSDYDGLVCVGGDGMFAELCHGLLLRTTREAQMNIDNPHVNILRPQLRIGVIPAGSTDAVVFGTTGLNDPVTSALQIIVGESLFIDITTVHNENGFVRFMATMLAYGFFGDIIQQSNRWRCLGPLRYDLAGFFQFIRNKSYHSELTITLSPHESVHSPHIQTMTSINGGATSSVAPDRQQLISRENSDVSEAYRKKASTDSIEKLVTPTIPFCSRNCGKCAEEEKNDPSKIHLPIQIKREGRYTTINCLNMPCRCAKSKYGMSPFVHLGDGTFDLLLVKRSWRTGFLRFLWQVANDSRSIEDLPNVERYRVSEVLIRPINTGGKRAGHWSCDGELFEGTEIQVRVHRQALGLFASGIQFEKIPNEKLKQPKSNSECPCFRRKKGETTFSDD